MNEIVDTINKLGVKTEIFSNKSLIIEGCDSITDINEEYAEIKCGRMKIEIKGKHLKIVALTSNSLCLKGIIHSVNFTY